MSSIASESALTRTDEGWHERFDAVMMGSWARPGIQLVSGEGAWVTDSDGRRYLDFLAGIAVNVLGHAHPVIVETASRQAARLVHVSNLFATAEQIRLAERLVRLTGAGDGGRVFFANSGAEAVEAAFKLARLAGGNARRRILALESSFHGRTMGALALTGKPALRAPFEPMPAGVEHLPATIEALERALDDDVAALVVEPIQGEAGVLPLPDGYLERARELTREAGALLVVDEIQTGVGRTGAMFAFQHAGIRPDAITLAKGLAGGVPIGALVTFDAASELFAPGQHGTTFGGNPFATAVGDAVLAEIERADLAGNAERRGGEVRAAIRRMSSPHVAEVRGAGLMLGVVLTSPVATDVARAALAHGLIVNAPNDGVIRLVPPLVIGDEEVAAFAERFAAALADVPAPGARPESDAPLVASGGDADDEAAAADAGAADPSPVRHRPQDSVKEQS